MSGKSEYSYEEVWDETTESTEKLITADSDEKFEIILDIIKVHTAANLGED